MLNNLYGHSQIHLSSEHCCRVSGIRKNLISPTTQRIVIDRAWFNCYTLPGNAGDMVEKTSASATYICNYFPAQGIWPNYLLCKNLQFIGHRIMPFRSEFLLKLLTICCSLIKCIIRTDSLVQAIRTTGPATTNRSIQITAAKDTIAHRTFIDQFPVTTTTDFTIGKSHTYT